MKSYRQKWGPVWLWSPGRSLFYEEKPWAVHIHILGIWYFISHFLGHVRAKTIFFCLGWKETLKLFKNFTKKLYKIPSLFPFRAKTPLFLIQEKRGFSSLFEASLSARAFYIFSASFPRPNHLLHGSPDQTLRDKVSKGTKLAFVVVLSGSGERERERKRDRKKIFCFR